ncbi:hypothetical protein OV450_3394 [Actinobacteria bacterium OV450]|nr:hypothetical protein OV450_3394 [Actinobacteria bacterium OV450]
MNTTADLHLIIRDGKAVAVADDLPQAKEFAETVTPPHLGANHWSDTGKLFAVTGQRHETYKWTGWEVRPIIHAQAS